QAVTFWPELADGATRCGARTAHVGDGGSYTVNAVCTRHCGTMDIKLLTLADWLSLGRTCQAQTICGACGCICCRPTDFLRSARIGFGCPVAATTTLTSKKQNSYWKRRQA